jgi:hypothetical protein
MFEKLEIGPKRRALAAGELGALKDRPRHDKRGSEAQPHFAQLTVNPCDAKRLGILNQLDLAPEADEQRDSLKVRLAQILLKNSNFRLDHNSEDRWQPRWKFP